MIASNSCLYHDWWSHERITIVAMNTMQLDLLMRNSFHVAANEYYMIRILRLLTEYFILVRSGMFFLQLLTWLHVLYYHKFWNTKRKQYENEYLDIKQLFQLHKRLAKRRWSFVTNGVQKLIFLSKKLKILSISDRTIWFQFLQHVIHIISNNIRRDF